MGDVAFTVLAFCGKNRKMKNSALGGVASYSEACLIPTNWLQ